MLKSFLTILLVAATLGLITSTLVSAEEILLKKEVLQGWKYSADSGDTYQKVGTSGTTLRRLVSGNVRADYEMELYGKRKRIAVTTGYIGAGLLGLLLVSVVIDDWDEDYQWLIMGATGTGLVSAIYGASAKNHLKEAVRVYNRGQDKGISVEVCLQPMVAQRSLGAGSFLRIRF